MGPACCTLVQSPYSVQSNQPVHPMKHRGKAELKDGKARDVALIAITIQSMPSIDFGQATNRFDKPCKTNPAKKSRMDTELNLTPEWVDSASLQEIIKRSNFNS